MLSLPPGFEDLAPEVEYGEFVERTGDEAVLAEETAAADLRPGARIAGLKNRHRVRHGEVLELTEARVGVRLPSAPDVVPGDDVLVELDEFPEDMHVASGPTMVLGTVETIEPSPGDGVDVAVSLARPLSRQIEGRKRSPSRFWVVPVAAAVLLIVGIIKYYNYHWFWYDPVFQTYSLGVAFYIISRAILSIFYREPGDNKHTPTATVVIAVMNEEDNIGPTIDHIFKSDYPRELLDVIVIDDGSTDRTWEVLRREAEKYPRMSIYRFTRNRGKRHAMALGALKARGEILVYVDSDSFVERLSIYRLVQPFVEPKTGAVAGHIQIIINPKQILSKMERVRYFVSHRVIKACESMFGAVTCCSGAFSAYRRSAVMPVLKPWLLQTFMGTRATFGDDRSLTNHVLRNYEVIFHHQAICWTFVPDSWGRFFRQQLRWKKSWTRETIAATKIMWRKHPVAAFSYYMGVIMTLISPLIVLRALVYMPVVSSASAMPYLLGLVLVYLFFCLFFHYHTQSRFWLHGLGFAALYILVLCWQNYYAMFTVNKTHWGTR